MQSPVQYYLLFGAAFIVVTAFIVYALRRSRPRAPSGNAYVQALRLLIEGHKDSAFFKLQEAVKSGTAPTHETATTAAAAANTECAAFRALQQNGRDKSCRN